MFRFDAVTWAVATAGITAVEPDPSFAGFMKNAGVIGSVIAAGWLVENRIGKKIGDAISAHTAVEDERLKTVKAEFNGAVATLGAKLDAIHELAKSTDEKFDERPCAITCGAKGRQ